MNKKLKKRLQTLSEDYAKEIGHGEPFQHFFCPILYVDEPAKLAIGHIVPQSFKDIPRQWTVQRKDVENFFGTYFESEFEKLQYEGTPIEDAFLDPSLQSKLNPKMSIEENNLELYRAKTKKVYEKHSLLIFENDSDQLFGAKIPPDEFEERLDREITIEYQVDVTVQSFISLIKAAHLTLFSIFKYEYAKSLGAREIASQILGKLFRDSQSQNQNKEEVMQNAKKIFQTYRQLARPVEAVQIDLKGTISDNKIFICRNHNKQIWGVIVFIYIGGLKPLHAVSVPMINNISSLETFLLFRDGKIDRFDAAVAKLNNDKWEVEPWHPINWNNS